MKNRIFALLAILIVFSTTLVVQVSAKEEGSDVLSWHNKITLIISVVVG